MNRPDLTQDESLATWRTITSLLNTSLVFMPPKPFWLLAKGTLCQALMDSSCTQVCQAVVNGQAMPASLSLSASSSTSSQVLGGLFGSRPAFLNISLL